MTDPQDLRRVLGWPALAAYGLGAILGAGIYSVIGAAAGRVGDAMWLAFALSAVVALGTALAYAELATMFPRAGAEFLYVRAALPRWRSLAFTTGIMMAAAAAATCATVAIAFAGYLSPIVDAPMYLVAPVLICALTAVAILGVKESARLVALFTAIEAVGLVVVIVLGATSERFGAAFLAAPTLDILPGAALVFFSYLGFENISNLAEETKQPERNLPRAILASVGVSMLLYIAVAVAVVALMPASELATSDAPLADAVRSRSSVLAGVLGGIALFATANTAMAALISGSRILYAMARAGELPRPLVAVLPRRRTPWSATLVVAGAALALLPLGGVAVVASMSSFASLLAFAAVNAALIVLRYREPERSRPFRVPLAVGALPLVPLVGGAAALVLVSQLAPKVIVVGGVLVAVTFAAYVILHRARDA